MTVIAVTYHNGAIAPLYIGMVQVGQHSHTFEIHVSVVIETQSEIRLHERVYTYGQNLGVLKK